PIPGDNVFGVLFSATPAERRPPGSVKMQGIAGFRENAAKRSLRDFKHQYYSAGEQPNASPSRSTYAADYPVPILQFRVVPGGRRGHVEGTDRGGLSACAVGAPAGSRKHAKSSSTADTGVFVRRAVSAQTGRRLSGGMDSEYGVVVVDEGIPGAEFAARLGKGCEWGIEGVRAGEGVEKGEVVSAAARLRPLEVKALRRLCRQSPASVKGLRK